MYDSTLPENLESASARGGARWVQSYWRRKNRLMVAMMAAVGFAWAVSGYTVYKFNLRELERQLSTTAKNHARVVEAAAEAAAKNGGLRELLASFNVRSYGSVSGKSVQFAYGTLQNDLITIYDEGLETKILRLASQSPIAQPMLLALSGQSGIIVADDHKGRKVLAAYEPVPGWKLAVVLKITIEEVRAPFLVEASIVAPIIISVLVLLLVMLLRTTNPIIRHLERSLAHGEFVSSLSNDAIVEIDNDGLVASYNHAAEEFFGYSRATVVGQHIRCLVPEVLPGSSAAEAAAYLTRKADRVVLQRSDGSTFEAEVSLRGLRQLERSTVTLVFARLLSDEDMPGTAIERNEHATALSEVATEALNRSNYTEVFAFAAAKIAHVLDVPVCKIWETKPASHDLLLRAAVGVPQDTIGELTIPATTSSHAGYVFSTHQPAATEAYASETRFGALDTRPGNALISGLAVPVKGPAGDIGVVSLHTQIRRSFAQDEINFVKAVADLLALSYQNSGVEDRSRCLSSAFEASIDPTLVTDSEGQILFANPAFEVTSGFKRSEILGNTLQLIASNSSLAWLDPRAERLLSEGRPWQGTRVDIRRDGSPFSNQRTIYPINDEHGVLRNYLVTIRETGTKARATLDSAMPDAPESSATTAAKKGRKRKDAPSPQDRISVLVAEDNAETLNVVLRQLDKLGYAAKGVTNGFEALEAIDKQRFDMILMDCAMPDMDGWETTSAIRRRDDNARELPIIAMTAHTLEGDREQCLAAGMDDFIAKPVTTADLKPVIERWLPGNRPSGSVRRRFGLVYDVFPDEEAEAPDGNSSLGVIIEASKKSEEAGAELKRAADGTAASRKPKSRTARPKRKSPPKGGKRT